MASQICSHTSGSNTVVLGLKKTRKIGQQMKISQKSLGASFITGRKHVPGRAGGGWESSEDEAETGMSIYSNF